MYRLVRSKKVGKKFTISTPSGGNVHFGAKGYEDYTIHKDDKRKASYVARHSVRENWTKSGINTAGFWSYWLLWNKKTLEGSIKDTEKKFDIKIIY